MLQPYKRLHELTYNDLTGRVSSLTGKFRSERNAVKGREVTLAKLIDYDFGKNTLYALTDPTYNFNTDTFDNRSNQWQKDNSYTMQVQFIDMDGKLREISALTDRDIDLRNIGLSDFRVMIKSMDIKVDCDCPSFNWQGHRYKLSNLNSAIYPTSTSDPVWGARHSGGGLCKHLAGFLKVISFNAGGILKYIRQNLPQ